MKKRPMNAISLIRNGLMLAAAVFWFTGCDAISKTTPQQNMTSKGAPTMNSAQTATLAAVSIPPVDQAEPDRLETATFATG